LRGAIRKESDAGNRNMYLMGRDGRKHHHIETRGAARYGGRLEPGRLDLRGVFVFPAAAAGEKKLLFFDEDTGTIVSLSLDRVLSIDESKHDSGDDHTPLSLAAANGATAVVRSLLDRGADPNAKTARGTPLHEAAAHGHRDVVRLLLDAGANPGLENEVGLTPMEMASAAGYHQLARELERLPPAGRERGLLIHEAALNGDVSVLRELLEGATDVEGRHAEGTTALMSAVRNGHLEAARLLIQAGADLDARGDSPTYWAVVNNHLDILALLLNAGADANTRSSDGTPVLMYAQSGEASRLLLEGGADLAAVDAQGRTALTRYFLRGAAMRSYASESYRPGDPPGPIDPVRLVLEAGIDVNSADHRGNTALFYALTPYMGRAETAAIQLLIDYGADVNARNHDGETPLFYAINPSQGAIRPRALNLEVIELLLAEGADPITKNAAGETVHSIAARQGSPRLLELLPRSPDGGPSTPD
jgi:ankyrin repeat protein